MAPLFEAFPSGADAVMIGDSITALVQWSDVFPGKQVANRGIPGDTVDGVWRRLDPILKVRPQKVFIMLGINDLIMGSKAEAVLQTYTKIIGTARSSGAKVFIQSTLLTSANYSPNINAEVRKVDDGLVQICAIMKHCTYIDLNARLAPDGFLVYTLDGVHLSAPGYAIWRDEIERYMY
jgi:lysophospholipase L1-like esterase